MKLHSVRTLLPSITCAAAASVKHFSRPHFHNLQAELQAVFEQIFTRQLSCMVRDASASAP
jgi:hypothetical protein